MMRVVLLLSGMALLVSCDGSLDRAKDMVRKELSDPGSAKFEDVRHCGSSGMITGKVNSKNQFGGYIGSKDFFVVDGSVYLPGVVPLVYDEPYTARFMMHLTAACEGLDYGTKFGPFLNSYDFANDTWENVSAFQPFGALDAPSVAAPRPEKEDQAGGAANRQ